VPAAAVTPALIVYIKVVAVKKLVVGFQRSGSGRAFLARLNGNLFFLLCLGREVVFLSLFFLGAVGLGGFLVQSG